MSVFFNRGSAGTEGFRERQAVVPPVASKKIKIRLKLPLGLDALFNSLSKYFPSIFVDPYNWIRNPFVEFEPCQGQFTLKEEEELVSVASDRMLDAFRILVNDCL